MSRVKYDPEAIIRALDIHKANGLIRGWRFNEMARWRRGGTERPFFIFVDLVDGENYYELRNEREASVFVHGLASAHHAQLRKGGLDPAGTDIEALARQIASLPGYEGDAERDARWMIESRALAAHP